jgi:hypothetical protein
MAFFRLGSDTSEIRCIRYSAANTVPAICPHRLLSAAALASRCLILQLEQHPLRNRLFFGPNKGVFVGAASGIVDVRQDEIEMSQRVVFREGHDGPHSCQIMQTIKIDFRHQRPAGGYASSFGSIALLINPFHFCSVPEAHAQLAVLSTVCLAW